MRREQLRTVLYLGQLALRHLAIMMYAWYEHYQFLAWIPVVWQSVCVATYLCNLSPCLILPGQPGLASGAVKGQHSSCPLQRTLAVGELRLPGHPLRASTVTGEPGLG